MAKSVKANASASVKAGNAPAEDQCFDWPISIPDGVIRKRVPVKFPIDMRAVRAKEKQKREAAEKAAAGKKGPRMGEYMVTMSKGGQPHLVAPPPKATKMALWTVISVFAALLIFSVGLFTYFITQAPDD